MSKQLNHQGTQLGTKGALSDLYIYCGGHVYQGLMEFFVHFYVSGMLSPWTKYEIATCSGQCGPQEYIELPLPSRSQGFSSLAAHVIS